MPVSMDGSENAKTPPARRQETLLHPGALLRFGFGVEAERGGVDAVALAFRGRTVLEHVSLVGAADGAVYLRAAHEEAAILFSLDVPLVYRCPETRPARARVVLGVRREERRPAGHTPVDSLLLVVVVLTAEGPLCALHPRDAVLLGGELILPLFFRLLYLPWRISHAVILPRRLPALEEANNAPPLFNPLVSFRLHAGGRTVQSVLSEPSTAVTWLEKTPPFPWTRAMFGFSTWRSPHSPRSWRTASTIRSTPYMPGWLYECQPPLVFTASSPPGEILPPRRRPHPPLSRRSPDPPETTRRLW